MKKLLACICLIAVIFSCNCLEENFDCRGKLKQCLENLTNGSSMTGLPSSKEQINKLCGIYKKGNQCIDSWMKECLPIEHRKLVYEQRKGAMFLMKVLCDDITFQNEYLNHTSCIEIINDDWNRCMNNFQIAVKRSSAEKNDTVLCCAKYGFNKCVSLSSKAKCDRSAAIMLRRISETLSADTVRNIKCENLQMICSKASKFSQGFNLIFAFFVIVSIVRTFIVLY